MVVKLLERVSVAIVSADSASNGRVRNTHQYVFRYF